MADLAAGCAMGLPFTVLYEVIKEAVPVNKTVFGPLLKELDCTIDSLKPLIDDMNTHNKVLDLPEKELREFIVQMEKGSVLIRKCTDLSKWRSYKKYKYSNQLLELQKSLQNLERLLLVQQARDGEQTLALIKNLEAAVLRMDGEGPAGWKEGMNDMIETLEEGMNDMKETLEEVKKKRGTMVQQIDQKGEVQSQIDSEVLDDVWPESDKLLGKFSVQGNERLQDFSNITP